LAAAASASFAPDRLEAREQGPIEHLAALRHRAADLIDCALVIALQLLELDLARRFADQPQEFVIELAPIGTAARVLPHTELITRRIPQRGTWQPRRFGCHPSRIAIGMHDRWFGGSYRNVGGLGAVLVRRRLV